MRERERARMNTFRFVVEKHYKVEADNYDEAIAKINSEQEYQFVVDESWQILEGERTNEATN
jgi:hypothetical protein